MPSFSLRRATSKRVLATGLIAGLAALLSATAVPNAAHALGLYTNFTITSPVAVTANTTVTTAPITVGYTTATAVGAGARVMFQWIQASTTSSCVAVTSCAYVSATVNGQTVPGSYNFNSATAGADTFAEFVATNAIPAGATVALTFATGSLDFTNFATQHTIAALTRSSNMSVVDAVVTQPYALQINFPIAATPRVVFHANGGTGTMADQLSTTAVPLSGNVFSNPGYTFAGWNTVRLGGGTAYADGASYPFTSDTTLYAQWTPVTTSTASSTAGASTAATPALASTGVESLTAGLGAALLAFGSAAFLLTRRRRSRA